MMSSRFANYPRSSLLDRRLSALVLGVYSDCLVGAADISFRGGFEWTFCLFFGSPVACFPIDERPSLYTGSLSLGRPWKVILDMFYGLRQHSTDESSSLARSRPNGSY